MPGPQFSLAGRLRLDRGTLQTDDDDDDDDACRFVFDLGRYDWQLWMCSDSDGRMRRLDPPRALDRDRYCMCLSAAQALRHLAFVPYFPCVNRA